MADNKANNSTDADIKEDSIAIANKAVSHDDSVKQPPSKKQKQAKTGALWFFVILNFLFLFGLAAAVYWGWLQWQQMQENKDDNSQAIVSQIDTLQDELGRLNNAITTSANSSSSDQKNMQTSIDNLMQEVLETSNATSALESKVSELSGRRPSDWLLAEADYLVRMAGRKLWLENDVKTSMMMLQSADTRLQDLADPSLFPVRKLIALDIQTLHQVNPISHSSIALAISGMIPQVENLEIAALKIPQETQQTTNELSSDISDWRTNLAKTWRAIVADFISVSRTEQAVEPYLAEKQQWLIKEQIKHALAQAQSAVLAGNETLYQASLQQAMALIVEYYQLSSVPVEQFMSALQQLVSTSIATDYPSVLQSAQALADVIDNKSANSVNNSQTGEL